MSAIRTIDTAADPQAKPTQGASHHDTETHELERLRAELRVRDRELRVLRDQLRAIHNSESWAVLRTLSQIRYSLAPRGTWRDALARAGMRGLRRLKKTCSQMTAALRQARLLLDRRVRLVRIDPGSPSGKHGAWSILCLPVIEWSFRFQRPQQLMRQFARNGHRVLYAANHFHAGSEPRLRSIEPGIDELILPGDAAANVYQTLPSPRDVMRMLEAVSSLGEASGRLPVVIMVQLPYWGDLAEQLHLRFGWPIVYDCMDEHAGFLHNTPAVLEAEQRLIATSDLVIASSEQLTRKVEAGTRRTLLLRNACEYHHFAIPDHPLGYGPPVIGYYGAIAEWFDTPLVEELARLRPGWRFELIGSTLAGDVRTLEDMSNVRLLGERPYAALPGLIEHWCVFIIPFHRVPLTEATNPVKVYEMLATGRPVVAVGLPELVPMAREGLITLADDAPGFAAAIDELLLETDPGIRDRRRAYARANTWEARHDALSAVLAELVQSHGPPARAPTAAFKTSRKDFGP